MKPAIVVKGLVLLLVAIYVGAGLTTTYIDPDTIIYTMIGDEIVRNGRMPFTAIFDHKPVVTYYVYGLWHALYPFAHGMFTALAVVCALITAWAACHAFRFSFRQGLLWFCAFYAFFGINYSWFTGNTEIPANVLIVLSIGLMLRPPGIGVGLAHLLAGLVAGIAINLNYLAGIVLAIPTLMLLFRDRSFVGRTLIYGCGVLAGIAIVFAPFLLQGASIKEYFDLQGAFGSSYSPDLKERVRTALDTGRHALVFLPMLMVYWMFRNRIARSSPGVNVERAGSLADEGQAPALTKSEALAGPATIAAPVVVDGPAEPVSTSETFRQWLLFGWIASAGAATLVSGQGFDHYFLYVVPPLVLLAMDLLFRLRLDRRLIALIVVPLLLMTCLNWVYWVQSAYQNGRAIDRFDGPVLSERVGQQAVLNIASSHLPLYLGRLQTIQPFIFPEHVQLVFAHKEVPYLLDQLARNPAFVLTGQGWCSSAAAAPAVCAAIQRDYAVTHERLDPVNPGLAYTLYQRRS